MEKTSCEEARRRKEEYENETADDLIRKYNEEIAERNKYRPYKGYKYPDEE